MSVAHTHRAGTTGTMLLMHLQGRDSGSALQEARLRMGLMIITMMMMMVAMMMMVYMTNYIFTFTPVCQVKKEHYQSYWGLPRVPQEVRHAPQVKKMMFQLNEMLCDP